jgi:hypothetical protein
MEFIKRNLKLVLSKKYGSVERRPSPSRGDQDHECAVRAACPVACSLLFFDDQRGPSVLPTTVESREIQ